ncbi:MAG: VOC family protein [Hyphomonadaceae bacterium]|nr:VOC family protein [Hyphomonadaceae bacterium]
MKPIRTGLAALVLGISGVAVAAPAFAQETDVTVRSIRVLATDPEALAKFYATAFGMSETRRPVQSPAFTEIVLNSGSTAELAKAAKSTPIVIATRRANEPKAGGMAALILEVPDMDKAIERATKAGAKLMRPVAKSGEGLSYAFLTDPDGNQVELLLKQ